MGRKENHQYVLLVIWSAFFIKNISVCNNGPLFLPLTQKDVYFVCRQMMINNKWFENSCYLLQIQLTGQHNGSLSRYLLLKYKGAHLSCSFSCCFTWTPHDRLLQNGFSNLPTSILYELNPQRCKYYFTSKSSLTNTSPAWVFW